MRKYILLFVLVCLHLAARGQTSDEIQEIANAIKAQATTAKTMMYWFDEDYDNAKTVTGSLTGSHTVDASSLGEGLHTLHYLLIDSSDKPASSASALFLVPAKEWSLGGIKYWYDEDYASAKAASSGVQSYDVSQLSDGLHTIHFTAEGTDGQTTPAYSSLFWKIGKTNGKLTATKLRYWFDEETTAKETATMSGVQQIDIATLKPGLHFIHYQAVDDQNHASTARTAMFYKQNTADIAGNVTKQRYWFDEDRANMVEGDYASNTQTINLSGIKKGVHTIHFEVLDDKGHVSAAYSSMFMKLYDEPLPNGINSLTKYRYWINDKSADGIDVTIDGSKTTFSYTGLIPLAQQPIRSVSFAFKEDNGVPTMYAKNDFSIRFYDAAGSWNDGRESYVDERAKQVLTDIADLLPTQRVAKPAENAVTWFKFDGEYGDSISLKSDRAVSLHIFDKDGNELYQAEGNGATQIGGCHLMSDGTFYVAVHDMTGYGSDLTLTSELIDKYAVFDFTPEKMSSVGKTLMYVKGNGMNYVKSVTLTNGTKTYTADRVEANTTDLVARFSMLDALSEAENYTVSIRFEDAEKPEDDKTISFDNAVKLEPINNNATVDIEIVTKPIVGDPYPIYVTLKNKGNVPLYSIPVNLALDNDEILDEFVFVNFDLLVSESLHGSRDFFTYTDNLVGTGKKGIFMPMVVPYLGPYEEKTFIFGVKTQTAHAKFNFYAWAGKPWYDSLEEWRSSTASGSSPAMLAAAYEGCEQSNIHDVYDMLDAADMADIPNIPISPAAVLRPFMGAAEAIAGIIQSGTRVRDDAVLRAAGLDPDDSANNQYRMRYRYCARSPREIFHDQLGDYASSDCPSPTPHPVDVYLPGDPNEITGYTAPSGSQYMTQDVKTIGYDIEFENDPEIANAAAHKIVVTNQLDASKFDLDSFTPQAITLSGKTTALDGSQNFVKTIDLRPNINALAELKCEFNEATGLATWTMRSLDPMTLEETDDANQGVLPVNTDGTSGIGNILYTVDLLKTFDDGTSISNQASIVFDNNDAIKTPVWTNTVDAVCPSSSITSTAETDATTTTLRFSGSDNRSGIWKYELYAKLNGEGTVWEKIAECASDVNTYDFVHPEGAEYEYNVIATDMAGNMEKKLWANLQIQLAAGWNWISHNQANDLSAEKLQTGDVNRILTIDGELYRDPIIGFTGNIGSVKAEEAIKVFTNAPTSIAVSGIQASADEGISLKQGWNWIGCPLSDEIDINTAITNAEEGDIITTLGGYAEYSGSSWTGDLTSLKPGVGYLYKSASAKSILYYDGIATVKAKAMYAKRRYEDVAPWTVDVHKYPNMMCITAELYDGNILVGEGDYYVAAFVGEECRGIGKFIDGKIFLSVYGEKSEPILFKAVDKESGESFDIDDKLDFKADAVGSVKAPYQLQLGNATGISGIGEESAQGEDAYNALGQKVKDTRRSGLYIYKGKKVLIK
ncbi:MAG: hypothetical protein ACI3Y0_12160 [Prevotella sp.]